MGANPLLGDDTVDGRRQEEHRVVAFVLSTLGRRGEWQAHLDTDNLLSFDKFNEQSSAVLFRYTRIKQLAEKFSLAACMSDFSSTGLQERYLEEFDGAYEDDVCGLIFTVRGAPRGGFVLHNGSPDSEYVRKPGAVVLVDATPSCPALVLDGLERFLLKQLKG